jgi:hypothetical protein
MAKPLPGTGLDPEFLKRAAEAIGLADVPTRNPFRRRDLPGSKRNNEEASTAGAAKSIIR